MSRTRRKLFRNALLHTMNALAQLPRVDGAPDASALAETQARLKTLGCTALRLRQLMRRVSQIYDVEMAKIGLKITQYSLLSHVLRLGPVRPGELAAAMQFTPSTLTRNLKPLIDAGWVAMSPGSDARSRHVTITEAGRAKRAEAQPRWKAAQRQLNDLLGAARVVALHGLIDESLALLDAGGVAELVE